MTYFENMIDSFNGSNYQNDVIVSAYRILCSALDRENNSIRFFEQSSEDDNDVYWRMSCEQTERAKGLLDAYKTLTNRSVVCVKCAIEDEMHYLEDIMLVKGVEDFKA